MRSCAVLATKAKASCWSKRPVSASSFHSRSRSAKRRGVVRAVAIRRDGDLAPVPFPAPPSRARHRGSLALRSRWPRHAWHWRHSSCALPCRACCGRTMLRRWQPSCRTRPSGMGACWSRPVSGTPRESRRTRFNRATTPGRYVLPPARAEAMYTPEVYGRSAGGQLVVR